MRRTERARGDAMARSPRGESRHWQIGPKIRIGGTLGAIGNAAKKVLPSTAGMIGSVVAPVGGLIASAANHSLGSDLAKGATNAAAAAGAVKALGLNNGTVTNPAGGDDPSSDNPPTDGTAPAQTNSPSSLASLIDYIKKGGTDIMGFLQGGGVGKVADLGLGALALKQAGDLQGKSNQYAQDALKTATDSYGSDTAQTGRAPLRLAGVANMLDPSKIATSTAGLGAVQGVGNPFAPKPPMPLGVQPRTGSPAGGPVPITPPLTRPPLAGQSYA